MSDAPNDQEPWYIRIPAQVILGPIYWVLEKLGVEFPK